MSPFLKGGQRGPDSRDMGPRANGLLLRTQSDVRLVELAQAGCDEAFEAIVDRYRAPLERYCGRLLRGDADDVVQQTFVNAWSALERGSEVRELRPWLYTIARHAVLRAVKRDGETHLELDESLVGGASAAAHVELKLHTRNTLAAVAALPDHQREAVIGTALEGRSREDVAQSLGLTEGAVRQLLHRARGALRTAVTAVTPLPLLVRLSGGRRGGITPDRAAELVAAGAGSGGMAAGALKLAAIGAASLALVGGPVVVESAVDGPGPARDDRGSPLHAAAPVGAGPLGAFEPTFGSVVSDVGGVRPDAAHPLDSVADVPPSGFAYAPDTDADSGEGEPAAGAPPSDEVADGDGLADRGAAGPSDDSNAGPGDEAGSEEPVADPDGNASGGDEPAADEPIADPEEPAGNGKYDLDLGNRYDPEPENGYDSTGGPAELAE